MRGSAAIWGVFFADGGFAGPNRRGLWEQVTGSAEIQMAVARIARQGHDRGAAPAAIFGEIEQVAGPANDGPPLPPPPGVIVKADEYRRLEAGRVAGMVARIRNTLGDERTVYTLMDWDQAPVPRFHRL